MKIQPPMSNNLTDMQKKAIEQLHEMYKKSKNYKKQFSDNQAKHFKNQSYTTSKKPASKTQKANILPNILDKVLKNSDITLIVVLVILLMDNEENFMLILALLYSAI